MIQESMIDQVESVFNNKARKQDTCKDVCAITEPNNGKKRFSCAGENYELVNQTTSETMEVHHIAVNVDIDELRANNDEVAFQTLTGVQLIDHKINGGTFRRWTHILGIRVGGLAYS